jgi:hypothetical protein
MLQNRLVAIATYSTFYGTANSMPPFGLAKS